MGLTAKEYINRFKVVNTPEVNFIVDDSTKEYPFKIIVEIDATYKATDRHYIFEIIDDTNNLCSFKSNGTKKYTSEKKENIYDSFTTDIIVKNPNIIGFYSTATIIVKINPAGKENHTFEYTRIPLVIKQTQDPKTVTFTPKIKLLNDKLTLNTTANLPSTLKFSLDPLAKFIDKGQIIYEIKIKDDKDNLVSFSSVSGSNSLVLDNGKTIRNHITNVATTFEESVIIRNPNINNYDVDLNLEYSIFYSLNSADIVTLSQFSNIWTETFPLNLKTNYNNIITFALVSSHQVNFQDTTTKNTIYKLSVNVNNFSLLNKNDYEVQLKIENDADNLFSFSPNQTKQEISSLIPTIQFDCKVLNPKVENYSKTLQLRTSIYDVRTGRKLFYEELLPITVSFLKEISNSALNVFPSFTQYIFKDIHVFRTQEINSFDIQGYTTLSPEKNYSLDLDIVQDTRNLVAFPKNYSTKKLSTIIDKPQIPIVFEFTNPTELNLKNTIIYRATLAENNDLGKVIQYSKLIELPIATTYSTDVRTIFNGENNVHVSDVIITPSMIISERENEVFLNLYNILPEFILTDTTFILNDANVLNQVFDLNITITGLNKGNAIFKVEDKLVFFENGEKKIQYDVDTTNNILAIKGKLTIQNPFKENYEKIFELLVSVSDGIEQYTKKFNLTYKTTYTIPKTEQYIKDIVSKINSDTLVITQKYNLLYDGFKSSLENISQDTFTVLNESIKSLDLTVALNTINFPVLFNTLSNSIQIERYKPIELHELEINVIPTCIVSITNLEDNVVTIIDSKNYLITDMGLTLIDYNLNKGKYILHIEAKNEKILDVVIDRVNSKTDYSVAKITGNLTESYQNQLLYVDGNLHFILFNTKNELYVMGDVTQGDLTYIQTNVFDPIEIYLTVNNYELDDMGAIFLNKKITDLVNKIETYYDEKNNVIFTVKTERIQNTELRTSTVGS